MNYPKLLIATTNKAKLAEISSFLSDVSIVTVSLGDIGITSSPDETGKTFEENAILKAKYYYARSGLPTLADDGGFEIDALAGEPGVKSHRWVHGNRDSTDEELIAYTIKRLEGVPLKKRQARLRLVLALALSPTDISTSTAAVEGIVPLVPSEIRTSGYPYRSLLYLPLFGKFYDHSVLTPGQMKEVNHRMKAIEELKGTLRTLTEMPT